MEPLSVVIASHNAGKVREMRLLLQELGWNGEGADTLGLPEPEETEATFLGNARLKARACARLAGMPALADDSGLCVHALDGAPGIYSARWAGETRDFTQAAHRIRDALADTPDRSAWFICALSLVWPDGRVIEAEGRVDGTLVFPGRGDRGFGYDPIFVPAGETMTFAEMDPVKKEAMSHRRRAWDQLVQTIAAHP